MVICTNDRTYNVRQVSTSNTVLVTQSSSGSSDVLRNPGTEAIAQCTSMLELSLAKDVSAVPLMKVALPVYTSAGAATGSRVSKQALFDNIPLSDAECEQGWRELCCFQIEDAAFVPSATVIVDCWRTILTTATAAKVDLAAPIGSHHRDALEENDSEWPIELNRAIITHFTSDPERETLDAEALAKLVGVALLRCFTDEGRKVTGLEDFLTAWADLLPESWRARADVNLLEGYYSSQNGGMRYLRAPTNGTSAAEANAAPESKGNGAKRKWHEKFRASKKGT